MHIRNKEGLFAMLTQQSTQEQIFVTIKEVVLAYIGTDVKLYPETQLEGDLAVDSLELVELGVKLEKLFDIKLDNQQVRLCKTLQDLVGLVQSTKQS